MSDKRTIVICDTDAEEMKHIQEGLQSQGYSVRLLQDASGLADQLTGSKPGALIVNPDMKGFDENDICTRVIQKGHVPVILLLDKHSTHRATVGDCRIEVVVTKPVDMDNLLLMLTNQIVMNSNLNDVQ